MDEKAHMCLAKDHLLPPLQGEYLAKCHLANSNNLKKKSAWQKSRENGIKEFGTVVEHQKTNLKNQSSFFQFER